MDLFFTINIGIKSISNAKQTPEMLISVDKGDVVKTRVLKMNIESKATKPNMIFLNMTFSITIK